MERNEIRFNRALLRQQQALGAATWRAPIHGTSVLVNAEGKVCASVKELGSQFPKKDRRYAARMDGVEWWTTNTPSPVPRFLVLRGFLSRKAAETAIDEARAIIMASTEEDCRP